MVNAILNDLDFRDASYQSSVRKLTEKHVQGDSYILRQMHGILVCKHRDKLLGAAAFKATSESTDSGESVTGMNKAML